MSKSRAESRNLNQEKANIDLLNFSLFVKIRLIKLPDNNYQFNSMISSLVNYPFLNENQASISLAFYSVQSLKDLQISLMGNLQNALKTNRCLIVNALYHDYFKIQEPTCCASFETRESLKNMRQVDSESESDSAESLSGRKSKAIKKKENYDTKNIPKNFGTAIHIYIKKNTRKVKNLLAIKKIPSSSFYQFLREAKQKVNSLLHLRELWQYREGDSDAKLKQCYRILSFQFMRRHCLSYIFSSRIKNTSSHVRYRRKLIQGIERPSELFNLKDY